MHILVAALLALSCFMPSLGGALPANASGPIDDEVRSERVMPDFDDHGKGTATDENRARPDRTDDSQKDQNSRNGDVEQNSSDANDQNANQDASNGTTQNSAMKIS